MMAVNIDRFNVIVNDMQDGVVIVNDLGILEFVNPAINKIFGYNADELLSQNLKVLIPDFFFYGNENNSYTNSQFEKDKSVCAGIEKIEARDKSGNIFPVELTINEIIERGEEVFIVVIHDISKEEFDRKQFIHLSYNDSLTGLSNRSHFFDRTMQALVMADRSNNDVAIFTLGLDRFKVINESLGQTAGDTLLVEVAQRLKQSMRESDTIARTGADEFSVLLENIDNTIYLSSVVQNIQDQLLKPYVILGEEVNITTSVGICLFPSDGDNAELLMKNANVALSQSKKLGGGKYQFYSADMNKESYARLSVETRLRHALENEELLLFYQPKVDIKTGLIHSLEALIRWQQPEIGLVSPVEFIPLLEETGLIVPVGEWVIAEACKQNRIWQQAGYPKLTVDVNLSPRQFMQKDLVEVINRILIENMLEPKYLGLEITEGSLLHDIDEAILTMEKFSEMGLSTSIDDFGTGYSSLSYLQRLPFDIVKIDQSFVRDVTTDPDSAAIVRSIISLSHNLGLDVVAEGVETEAQLGFMAQNHCDLVQGYYFSKPISAADMTQLLKQDNAFDLTVFKDNDKQRTLLILDDEKHIASALKRVFGRQGYTILTAISADEAFNILATHKVGVIISDQRMPTMTGTEFFSRVKDIYPESIRIILSGYTELESLTDAINKGAIYKFFTKPWDDEQLRQNISEAFKYYEYLSDKL